MGLDSGIDRKRNSFTDEELAYWRKCYDLDSFFREKSNEEIIPDAVFSIDIDLIEIVRNDAYNYMVEYKKQLDKVCKKYRKVDIIEFINNLYTGTYTEKEEEEIEELMYPIKVNYFLIDYGASIWNSALVAVRTYTQLTNIIDSHQDGDEYIFWSSY